MHFPSSLFQSHRSSKLPLVDSSACLDLLLLYLLYLLSRGSLATLGDIQTSSIALSLMRAKLFQNIVGDQALQCARAASQQARRSGNLIWMSVADNMLAQSLEVQGQAAEAQNVAQAAINHAVLASRNGDYDR